MIFKTIADVYNYFQNIIQYKSYSVSIDRGSFEKTSTTRQQFEFANAAIEYPLDFTILPLGITTGAVQKYYEHYILGCVPRAENETYTYAERISIQLPEVIKMLVNTPYTNQAAISISMPEDIFLHDPPCLREITFKVIPGKGLQLTSFWRSNDLDSAFVFNQCSMSLLLRDVADAIMQPVYRLIYISDGLHKYKF